jgi:hypothetical protein
MTLAEYLTRHSLSDAKFGQSLRHPVCRQAIYRYRTGRQRPKWSVIDDIREATGGQVTANDYPPATIERDMPHGESQCEYAPGKG